MSDRSTPCSVMIVVCLPDDGQEIKVPVLLNGTESILEFIDLPYSGVSIVFLVIIINYLIYVIYYLAYSAARVSTLYSHSRYLLSDSVPLSITTKFCTFSFAFHISCIQKLIRNSDARDDHETLHMP